MTQAAVEAWARQPTPPPSRAGWIVALIVGVLALIGAVANGIGPHLLNEYEQWRYGVSAHIDGSAVSKNGPTVNSFTFQLDLKAHSHPGEFYAVVQSEISGPQDLYAKQIPQPGDGSTCRSGHTKDVCATFPIGGKETKTSNQLGSYQVSIYWVPQDDKMKGVASQFLDAASMDAPFQNKTIPGGLQALDSAKVRRTK
jgi:hypothetical protein